MMEDRPLRDDEYPEDEHEAPPRPRPDMDPISTAVGSGAFVYRHMLQDCVERFGGPVARFPEHFDRFYFDTPSGQLLIDIVEDATDEQRARSLARKHVDFKRRWCAEHGRRYLVLGESESTDLSRIRELLDQPAAETEAPGPSRKPKRQPARKRGQISRPQAATA